MVLRGIEPVFHSLARAGLLESFRGARGGYALGKFAKQISLAQTLIAVVGSETSGEMHSRFGGSLHVAAVEPLWIELEQMILTYLQETTLEDLIMRARVGGVERAVSAPIAFSI
jgi:Rrf2 family transcriptional regulator, iron-sulfur cluster assembly transcription factor